MRYDGGHIGVERGWLISRVTPGNDHAGGAAPAPPTRKTGGESPFRTGAKAVAEAAIVKFITSNISNGFPQGSAKEA